MKFKHTLILLLLAGGIGSYIWFVDRKMPTTKELEAKKGRLFDFDRDKITGLSIKTPETKIELKKDGATWRVEDPVKDRADSNVMNTLLTSIEGLRSEQTLDNDGKGVTKDQLKEFGLDDPKTKLRLTVDGKPVELLFGKDAAVSNKVYVMIDGTKSAAVVSNNIRNDISKKADEFRDRKLSDVTLAQVTKAVFKTNAGEMEVEKKNEHWNLVQPIKARGDDAKIGDTVSQALSARVESFVADQSKLAEYGLEQPRGTVTVTLGEKEKPQVLLIGGNPKDDKDKDKVYAKFSARDTVVLLPKTIEALLDTKPNDLRDKKLVQFTSDIVDRVHIEPAGKEKLSFARDNAQGWVRKADKDTPVNATVVTKLLDELAAASVTNFVADVATELPKYGLDQPAVKVTLASYSSENTAETKAGEKPIVSILFGKVEGENVYAKLDDEPFVFATPKGILDFVVTDPLQLQPLEIYKNKPDDIASFEVVRDGQPALSFERDKDKNWKLAKGDEKPNIISVQSLVNTLATLHAVRWVGAAKPEFGLGKPAVTVTFKTAANASGKLTLGAATADEMRYATVDGMNGVFMIPRPDFEAFATSLLDKPSLPATPAPVPGASVPPAPAGDPAKPRIEAVTPPVSAPPLPAPALAPEKPAKPPVPSEAPSKPAQQ